jgi:hypothetical protein
MAGPQHCRSITVYINIDLAFKPQFMVPRFSYVARGYKLGVLMQDLVSERDQSWVTMAENVCVCVCKEGDWDLENGQYCEPRPNSN